MKEFMNPSINVQKLDVEDVITTSTGGLGGNGSNLGGGDEEG